MQSTKVQHQQVLLHLGKPHEFGKYTIDGTVIKACDVVGV